ncbi:hypothetical protein ASQ66_gp51 [Aeropyrum pernix spindle-shaped virus 1]|uniref:Uncharacterized protein n=1 Tax=Aeropyrum pernix (strain ATCC 700893 / DSM 11879 / JCM 9820 / NBRC 100138 / K1) TaxID=272557 RepID=Q9YDM9_AERPE|nr:hypothetical protein [Aeropyrum pernix]YP_009177781.1 hypothetical protein ASQ66_gp51 [Aeropyrum pernix spindle-shaped virus 1]BAA79868.2 hypothetical protein APE_0885.1 [Aeropyrum pernix spindle-shaped virus 1] [Aeropyrum pernix K1]CCD22139.1 TPA: hypothetical protein [Aeropyrum pernix spindle-shaped virus 1]
MAGVDYRLQPYLPILNALTPAQAKAWDYLVEYVRATGRICFSYNTLARYWPAAQTKINIQTLDRRLREFAQLRLLERREIKKDGRRRARTIFCLPEDLASFYLDAGRG